MNRHLKLFTSWQKYEKVSCYNVHKLTKNRYLVTLFTNDEQVSCYNVRKLTKDNLLLIIFTNWQMMNRYLAAIITNWQRDEQVPYYKCSQIWQRGKQVSQCYNAHKLTEEVHVSNNVHKLTKRSPSILLQCSQTDRGQTGILLQCSQTDRGQTGILLQCSQILTKRWTYYNRRY